RLAASGKPNAAASDLIRQARDLAFTPIVSASLASQPEFLKLFASNKKEVAVSKQITGLEESWNRKARENYARAAELAQQAAALIK
ncbi:MAG: ABC transporter substrate-binding protein, partial [Burkholderiaceae bacterium]|nr:ABC transporter substrate-binding protein [Burkholderiaceae bacterium]